MAENDGNEATKVEDPLTDGLPAANISGLPDAMPAAPAVAEPLRDDQVSQAVSFLTNPKVASATAEAKRSFLVRKGLTPGEIDEAFRRVPSAAAPQAISATPPTYTAPVSYAAPAAQPVYPALPQQQAGQPQQQLVTTQPLQYPQQQLQQPPPPPSQGPRWSSIVLGLTAVAAGAYGIQRLVAPYVKEYYDRWAASLAVKGAAAPEKGSALTEGEQGAAAVLADAIKAQTEEMRATLTELKEVLAGARKGPEAAQQPAAPPIDAAALRSELRADVRSDLRAELRAFAETISELSGAAVANGATPASSTYGTPNRGSPAPSPAKVAGGPGTVAMHRMNGVVAGDGPAFAAPAAPKSGGSSVNGDPPKPASYEEVMAMLAAGQTPPGIRTDIRDTPPDAAAPPSASRIPPRPKPWERRQLSEAAEGAAPWRAAGAPGRAASVASVASSDPGEEAHPWRPPPMPQPSMLLPRRRAGSTTPPPKQDAATEEPAEQSAAQEPAHSDAPSQHGQAGAGGADSGSDAAAEAAPPARPAASEVSVGEITPAGDAADEASQGVAAGEEIGI